MKKTNFILYAFREVFLNGKAFFWIFIIKTIIAMGHFFLSVYLSKSLINEILNAILTRNINDKLLVLAISILLIETILAFINLILNYYAEISATKYNNAFTIKISQKCSRLKYELHDSPKDKNEIKQFVQDSKSIVNLFCQTVTFFSTIISFLISLIISIRFNVIITIISLAVALPTFFIRKKNKLMDYDLEKTLNSTDRIIDYYKSMYTGQWVYKEVHLFGAIPFFDTLLKGALTNRLEQSVSLKKAKTKREIFLLLIYTSVNIAINLYVIISVVLNNHTIGDYTYYTSIINNLKNNSDTLVTTFNEIFISINKVENYCIFLDNISNEYDIGSEEFPGEIESIEFVNVSFKYPNTNNFVLKNISFSIKKGEKIAFAGINGAGKTTIINLLLRFYEPTFGKITINGINIKCFNIEKYWRGFSCMFQQSNMYCLTLRENLLLGNLPKLNHIDDRALISFLSHMGMDIPVNVLNRMVGKAFDENGLIFSPGQEQRLNVVRTLLNDRSRAVILDEPSSSMDALTEDSILETTFEFSQNKMLIFISHRLSNLKRVDKIIFIEDGNITEIGNHNELIDNKGKYFELYNKQSNKYL